MRKRPPLPAGKEYCQRAIKVRIYPTTEQATLMAKTFGCCRFAWNQMLGDQQAIYAETQKHIVKTPASYKKQYPFLAEVDSLALANVQVNLNQAFSNFFKDPQHVGKPSFKSKKKSRRSYTTNCQYYDSKQSIEVFEDKIKLPKLGMVAANIYRKPMPGWKLKSATISQNRSGKYFCSLLYESIIDTPAEVLPTEEGAIGLDYSSPNFCVDDHGRSPEKIRWFRESEKKLAKMQRRLTRMQEGSKNYIEQKRKYNELCEHVANQRKDFAHKLSREIANSYNAVCVEALDLRVMSRTLRLGKSTFDNGFGMFRTFLEYKLHEQGKHLIVIDKWFPSSKTCSECGYVNKELTLHDRIWTCPCCGAVLPRDPNAGKNIKHEGIIEFYKARRAAA